MTEDKDMEAYTVTEDIIRKECKSKIDKYEKLHYRDINLGIIPEGTQLNDVHKILNIMIRKGYTFLAAYCVYKDRNVELIHTSDILNNDNFRNSKPTEKKIKAKLDGMKLGIINPVILNKEYRVIDGLAALVAMKRNGEKYVPYIRKNKAEAYGRCAKYHVNGRIRIREELFNKQDGKCYICGRKMTLDLKSHDWKSRATVDHVIPLSKGGSNSLSNCALSCGLCNQLKADSLLTPELKTYIAEQSKLTFESNKVIIEKIKS